MTKTFGYGSVLVVTTTTGDANIGQIRTITGPGVSGADVDTTCLDSSSNYRTFTPGLADAGEVTLALVYDTAAASHKILAEAANNRTTKVFTVYHGSSTGDTDVFSAYVKGITREIPLDDVITCDVTLKVSATGGYTT